MSGAVWIFGETYKGHFLGVTYEVIMRGIKLAEKLHVPVEVFTAAEAIEKAELEEPLRHSANKVIAVLSSELKERSAETLANIFTDMIREYKPQIVLAAATTTGRTIMPCVAARLGTGLTADCTELDIDDETGVLLQTRPAIGGNILATIKTPSHRPQMATVRPHSTPQTERHDVYSGRIETLPLKDSLLDTRTKFLGFRSTEKEGYDIQKAEKIISGGGGMKKKDNFKLIEETAALLDAAVGASRDAVDRGWAAYPQQVGLSGKTVVPKLYIAVGISGAIQHLAGMKTAETIIAINQDPDAQIFHVADFGVVTNLFEFLPILNDSLKKEMA
jgi:electron transfer flavoprotein alpha subunit